MLKLYTIAFLTLLPILACTDTNKSGKEMVMEKGMVIEATNESGTLTIEAKENLFRTYTWDNNHIKIPLHPRQSRWYGSFGAQNSGGLKDIHTVIEEGQQHFSSTEEALEWIQWQNHLYHYVYTSDGLIVGWNTQKDTHSSQRTLGVQVWQIYINGNKPKQLAGANNSAINVKLSNLQTETLPSAGIFKSSKPKIINGRLYAGKAIDYMSDPAIRPTTPEEVENTITNGKLKKYSTYNFYYMLDGDFMWVNVDQKGRVILIGK